MGKNSKSRREGKAKARRQQRRRADHEARAGGGAGPHTGDPFGFGAPPPPSSTEQWHVLAERRAAGIPLGRADYERLLRAPDAAERGAASALLERLDLLWRHGWQPREVRRQTRRTGTALATRLMEVAIHADHAGRSGQGLDPRWALQLEELGQRDVSTRGSWITAWREREGLDLDGAVEPILAALCAVTAVPPLDELIPPPGAAVSRDVHGLPPDSTAGVSDPTLQRVRKLLAKAESSEFEAEAAALSAKAQELMTRHAIDLALVTSDTDDQTPRIVRVPIDAPYADAKSYLLGIVARASRCRTVYLTQVAMSSVVGHAEDLPGVELLFTSLLVQAQTAMTDPAHASRPGARNRTQSYRAAFLLAFANRIAERLDAANDQVFAEAEESPETYLPVLRAREAAVEDFIDEHYGELTQGSVRGGYDPAGWAHGRQAADAAKLAAGEIAD